MIRLALSLTLLAALLGGAPATADQVLPAGRVTGNSGSGDILFGALKFGKRLNGKTILQPDGLEVLGTTRALGMFEASAQLAPPNDTFSIHQLYTVNNGPNTANGVGQTYISFATNPNFDVAHAVIADFRVSSSANQQSKLGQFIQVGSPPMPTGNVGAAVAEWNLTNRGADTGYQPSISSLLTYGGSVPLQQVGGLNLVPEANYAGAAGVGTNVTYGVMVSRSSNLSPRLSDGAGNNDYPRTYAAYGTDRDALVPSARANGGEGGRGFSFQGGTTAALAPYGVGQAWGFWGHGLDLSRATFAANDPIRVKAGNELVWETGNGTKVAGLTVTAAGVPRIIDSSGNGTDLIRGAWTVYTPTYTPAGGSGVTVTHNRASYEVVGKTLRMQVRFTLGLTAAPGYVDVTLPTGLTLKDGSAGAASNLANGQSGAAAGQPGANYLRIGGGAITAAANGGGVIFGFVGELN